MKRMHVLIGLMAASVAIGTAGHAVACGKSVQPGCASVPSRQYTVLLRETDDFGYWMTYQARRSSIPASAQVSQELIDANVQRHLGGKLNTGVATASVSRLLSVMHLSRFPARYTVTVLSSTDKQAVERIHWQTRGGHGPLVRLTWMHSVTGWHVVKATYLRMR